jgi:predicted XRE-type DNA-binding protein
MENLKSGYIAASFSLIHGLLLQLVKQNNLTKSQVIEIIDISKEKISFFPKNVDDLNDAETVLERLKIMISSL